MPRADSSSTSFRSLALAVLDRVRRTPALATEALREEVEQRDPDPRDSAAANLLALGVLRLRRCLDGLLEGLVERRLPEKDQRLMDLLRMGLFQLLYMDSVPDHAAVHSTVALVRRAKGAGPASFVNAVLRNATRTGRDALLSRVEGLPAAARLSFPDWMVAEAQVSFGESWEAQLLCLNRPAPIGIRVNMRATSRSALTVQLRRAGLNPVRLDRSGAGLVLPAHEPPYRTLPFAQGLFWPQDPASQYVTDLVECPPGGLVLDACAGTGTKTLGLATREGSGGEGRFRLVAMDRERRRVALLGRRLERHGIGGPMALAADLECAPFPDAIFDTVLLDAPCSGLGTMRRHPELKWRRSPEDVAANAAVQRRLLESASRLVRPGGTLVYSVCTYTRAEGAGVADSFLSGCRGFVPVHRGLGEAIAAVRVPGGAGEAGFLLPPALLDADCFYVAVLRREG